MITKWKYWRVICRYGHVGRKKEISVARYIRTENACNLMDVLNIASRMPGVKKRKDITHSIVEAKCINKNQYEQGIEVEEQNLYVQNLLKNRQVD
ncbi:hypothetical protein [Virgibacillus halodenitrificans]|uniref:hypothetical protein n=1 Tax=Virgibacillus halodenitrificans TaxID=1482 RepID=UPI001F219ECB|nr:hypothetical protein [Virgibacillus halodenitrificans]